MANVKVIAGILAMSELDGEMRILDGTKLPVGEISVRSIGANKLGEDDLVV